jgi:hypothetical protein
MLLHSAEVRWFFPGILQDAVLGAFQGRNEATRCDRYLRLPGVDTVGVKLRQGRFEVKARRGPVEAVTFTDEVSGCADCWAKWACAADKLDQLTSLLVEEPSDWTDIEKTRWTRVSGDPTGGCQVELTRIVVAGSHWWTLGLEAVGPMDAVRARLRDGATAFFEREYGRLELDAALCAATSASYPVWLGTL